LLEEDDGAEYDIDDPEVIGVDDSGFAQSLCVRVGSVQWRTDPNVVEMNQKVRYVEEAHMDTDGVEVGYEPIFGPSNPIDTRTILGAKDFYMMDDRTRADSMMLPVFPQDDTEIGYNQDVALFRKSLDIMEPYVDPFLSELEILRRILGTDLLETAKLHKQ
jgi:hypothetical protein